MAATKKDGSKRIRISLDYQLNFVGFLGEYWAFYNRINGFDSLQQVELANLTRMTWT